MITFFSFLANLFLAAFVYRFFFKDTIIDKINKVILVIIALYIIL